MNRVTSNFSNILEDDGVMSRLDCVGGDARCVVNEVKMVGKGSRGGWPASVWIRATFTSMTVMTDG